MAKTTGSGAANDATVGSDKDVEATDDRDAVARLSDKVDKLTAHLAGAKQALADAKAARKENR